GGLGPLRGLEASCTPAKSIQGARGCEPGSDSASVRVLDAGGLKARRRLLEQRERHRFVAALRHQHLAPAVVIAIEDVEDEALMLTPHMSLELEHAQPGGGPQVGVDDLERIGATQPE